MTKKLINQYFIKKGFVDEVEGALNLYSPVTNTYIDECLSDFFTTHKIKIFTINLNEEYTNSYGCSALSVAWIDKTGLHLETWLINAMNTF